ncbi:MAG: hypothetical protein LBC04_01030 [Holosporaceae bacterium]|jgi:hypothetical protein|nr:hypothetical protein [Holosporaceae bacterium]
MWLSKIMKFAQLCSLVDEVVEESYGATKGSMELPQEAIDLIYQLKEYIEPLKELAGQLREDRHLQASEAYDQEAYESSYDQERKEISLESFQEEHNVLMDEAFAAMSRLEQIPLQIVAMKGSLIWLPADGKALAIVNDFLYCLKEGELSLSDPAKTLEQMKEFAMLTLDTEEIVATMLGSRYQESHLDKVLEYRASWETKFAEAEEWIQNNMGGNSG